ncbi:MAG: TIGR01459 family HAD-type hydrolase [Alphaproteobacteria bacterium]|nr:MAG: TIGR01459 family HAD-type hydrolase [Alphaproteobacteria bacterium]
MTRIIDTLDEISDRYDALLCDLWGCVHDGIRPYPEAVAALERFRGAGGKVVLLTNAPRQSSVVRAHLDEMGLPRAAYDAIASSGDAARAAMYRGVVGERVWFMGEPHDEVFFAPADPELVADPVPIVRVPLEEAEGIVCTGPFDPHADPSQLRPQLLLAKINGLKLLCANPDIVVDRGETREWCAGAVARLYEEMGGESLYYGKPHPAIYDLARARLAALGALPDNSRILAIGDGIGTDIQGAMGEDIDSLFITGGIAAAETGTRQGQPDPKALEAFCAKAMVAPTWACGSLR